RTLASLAPACREGGSCALSHLIHAQPPCLDPVDDRPPAGIEQRERPRPGHPLRPLGLGAVNHVGGEISKEEEERRSEQALQCSEAAAEYAVHGPEHGMTPGPAADRPCE